VTVNVSRQRVQSSASGIPRRFLGLSVDELEGYSGDIKAPISGWVDGVQNGEIIRADGSPLCGVGLLLHGKPGAGKTALSCAILQDLISTTPGTIWGKKMSRPVYFSSYPKILQLMKDRMDDREESDSLLRAILGEDEASAVRVLVIDDLGKEYRNANRWAETMFDHLLRNRFDEGWPTIVTTNVPLGEWDSVYGSAMGSFAHEAFIPLAIMSVEGDRRRTRQE
jgi:DNA replication protein DnaC